MKTTMTNVVIIGLCSEQVNLEVLARSPQSLQSAELTQEHGVMVRGEAQMYKVPWGAWPFQRVRPYTRDCDSYGPLPALPTVQLIFCELLSSLKQVKFHWHCLVVCRKTPFVLDVLIKFYVPFLSRKCSLLGGVAIHIQEWTSVTVTQFC